MDYRREIDGLRAVAVIPVILFHAGFQSFSGGYVGVDVFFVISGYLITSILLSAIESGRFSLLHFYERRARRILPALLFYSALICVAASLIYPPHQLKDFGQSLFANSLFLSNAFFYLETDYFNDFSETAPLLHTWSLSLEEQYYLFVPLLLFLLHKYLRRHLLLAISSLLILSLAYAQRMLVTDPAASFYLLPSRFWELAAGSVLAIAGSWVELPRHPRASTVLSGLGIALLMYAVLTYGRTTPFPGFAAVMPVAGTALVVAFAQHGNLVCRALSSKLLVGVGLMSYSWYLSHHALFALSRGYGLSLDGTAVRTSLMTLSFLVALFSYRFVEQPFRSGLLTRAGLFASAGVMLSVLAAYGLYLHDTNGLKDLKYRSLGSEARTHAIDSRAEKAERIPIWIETLKHADEPFQGRGPGRVLILGDSKAQDFYVATTYATFDATEFRRLKLDDACMAPSLSLFGSSTCVEEFDAAVTSALYKDADEVLLTTTWQRETNGQVVHFVRRLLEEGKRVSMLSTANFNDVASLSFVVASGRVEQPDEGRFFYDNLRADWRHQYDELKGTIQHQGLRVRFLDKEDAFCDSVNRHCALKAGPRWFMWDSGHLTETGAIFFAARIKDLGWYR